MKNPQKKSKQLLIFTLIFIAMGVLFYVGMLFYSQNFTFMGHVDALFVGAIFVAAVGWFLFISNEGIFDVAIYGTKQFTLALVGRRPKKTLHEYRADKTKVDKTFLYALWIAGGILLIAAIIVYLVYKQQNP